MNHLLCEVLFAIPYKYYSKTPFIGQFPVLFKYNMKIPKLKFFYYALNETDYGEFERTRTVRPNSKTTLNPATGQISASQPFLYFYSTASIADTRYRQLNHHLHYPVFVLRIPREYVLRTNLTSAPDPRGMWIYSEPILLPHCGVERFELEPEQLVSAEVVASSRPLKVVIPVV